MKKRILLFTIFAMMLAAMLPSQQLQASTTEYRGVWFSYYDFQNYYNAYKNKNTKASFQSYFDKVLNNCKKAGFNRIIVQVRPFSDAIYKSKYFPMSACIAGKQGADLSYDPLEIMVARAHKKGMKIEAWINPYRVSTNTSYGRLDKSNPARKWHYSTSSSTRRNVLSYGGRLYYNPSKSAVRNLIVNGVKEIVKNYDVDGIHMDDYFYPSFTSSNYKSKFDYKEYNASQEKKDGMTIENYRRKQVSTLVKRIYAAVKAIDEDVTFGISPAGEINNLTSKYSYYVDIKTWTNSTKYVDYIAPQVYWGFYHKTAKFNEVVDQWSRMVNQKKVKLYIGLPAYKMGSTANGTTAKEKKELTSSTLLSKQIQYCRKKETDGFIVFDYTDIVRTKIKSAITKMTKTINEQ